MNFKPCLAALVLIAASVAAVAADTVVNFDQANPPFMYAKEGKPAGIYPALVAAAFKRMNAPLTAHSLPWSRALSEIDEGTAGVGGIYKNVEREKKYDYSQQLFVERLVVYFNKAKPVSFAKVDDLRGLRVGVIRGWTYSDPFEAGRKSGLFTAIDVGADEQNFAKLAEGRLDAVIAVAESGTPLLAANPALAAAPTPLAESPTYLAFAKSANQGELLKKFNAAVQELKSSGEFDKLVRASLK